MAPRELRRKVPGVDGALTTQPRTPSVHRGAADRVVDAVSARQRGGGQRQHTVPRVRSPLRSKVVEVVVDEFPQVQVLGEGGRQEQTGVDHQAVVVSDDADTIGSFLW